jgi:hypothetical protein
MDGNCYYYELLNKKPDPRQREPCVAQGREWRTRVEPLSKGTRYAACLLVFFGVALSAALGAEYYVAKTGSDNNPGTQGKPWLTIQKAANTLVAGDTVFVSPGTYDERVSTKTNGTQTQYIAFRRLGEGVVSMGGFDLNHDYILVEGFEMTGSLAPEYAGYLDFSDDSFGCVAAGNTIRDGALHVFGARFRPGSSHCVLSNNTFSKVDWICINLHGDSHLAESNLILDCPGWDAVRFFGHDHVVRGNFFRHIDKTGENHTDLFQTFGVNGDVCYNILVECNFAVDCNAQIGNFEADGADIRDLTFRNNTFTSVASTANMLCEKVRWYNNTFYNCSTRNNNCVLSFAASPDKGYAHWGDCKNNVFFGCGGTNDATSGWYAVEEGIQGFTADYNFVARKDGLPKTGFSEPHGINGGNPCFVDLAGDDFHLLKESPLVGKAVTLQGFTCDADGAVRSALWDMGAYEFLPEPPGNPGVEW